jgi:uncharacterized membrane protein YeiH
MVRAPLGSELCGQAAEGVFDKEGTDAPPSRLLRLLEGVNMLQTVVHGPVLAVHFGDWEFTGNITTIDLVAASTNALAGALLARRPDHSKKLTVVGILLVAILGGLGGGVVRDVILNRIPAAFTNPAYLALSVAFGVVGYFVALGDGRLFREGLFQFATAVALPWYAIAGAYACRQQALPIFAALALAVVTPTAGRYLVDVTCGVPPKRFVRSEWFVGTALLTGVVWVLCYDGRLNVWVASAIAFVVGFAFRVTALYQGWQEPLAAEPAGVYQHADGRPLLGRKLQGRSAAELHDLGLVPEDSPLDADG